MSNDNSKTAPFSLSERGSGLLLHVSSLPSPYGIGDFGPVALEWVDRLADAGQSWWQILPLGPTGYGNSPYTSLSSFAINPLLISPDWLIEEGLLRPIDGGASGAAGFVDYDTVAPIKRGVLKKACAAFGSGTRGDLRASYERFCQNEAHWLADYALFVALKAKFNDAHYLAWPADLVHRKPAALEHERQELAEQIAEICFGQFLLLGQVERLKGYAHNRGVKLIGDMPFFVSADSSDVWANPDLFLLDEHLKPRFEAGVPPDYFSSIGQLWGNPLYDWSRLRESGYGWWIDRLRSLLTQVDVVRLDHFRAFMAAWHVPAGSPTAQTGEWRPGPGAGFLAAVEGELGSLPFIAEDLGMITPDVYALRDQFHLPGMRVLQFAFDGHTDNPSLPENYVANAVVYTGTHDNPTTRGWFDDLPADRRRYIWDYLRAHKAKSPDAARAMIEVCWSSVAGLAIVPLQDLLNLGGEARMNVPGRPENNWRWRCTQEMLADPAFEWLGGLTITCSRDKPVKRPSVQTANAAIHSGAA
jgi:4-alpha-glucanotransferase